MKKLFKTKMKRLMYTKKWLKIQVKKIIESNQFYFKSKTPYCNLNIKINRNTIQVLSMAITLEMGLKIDPLMICIHIWLDYLKEYLN